MFKNSSGERLTVGAVIVGRAKIPAPTLEPVIKATAPNTEPVATAGLASDSVSALERIALRWLLSRRSRSSEMFEPRGSPAD